MEVYDEVCESNGDLCCEYEGSDNMKKISEHVENWENVQKVVKVHVWQCRYLLVSIEGVWMAVNVSRVL